jgi:large subunit ribosomal protein LP0
MTKDLSKNKIFSKIQSNLVRYNKMLVYQIKDIPANIIHMVRKILRGIKSEVVCGKTTVITKSIRDYIEKKQENFQTHHNIEELKKLVDEIHNIQILFIFTNEEISTITEITSKFLVEKQAKPGSIATCDVIIPKGPTGMDSSRAYYFGAMKIPFKVIKNQVEIVSPTKIVTFGQKITMSEINVMKDFKILPHKHTLKIEHIYMNGKLYDCRILKLTPEYIKSKIEHGIRNLAAFSIATHIPTPSSSPHIIDNAFKLLLGLSHSCNFELSIK